MIFDELENKLEEALDSIGAPTYASNKIGDAIEILYELREKYAQPVEMTEIEKDRFLNYVYMDGGNFFDLIEYETDYLYKKLSISGLMRAWLHPELIKVVDE